MAQRTSETATVSFHYLTRSKSVGGGRREAAPFSQSDFDDFCAKLIDLEPIDLSDEQTCKRIKAAVNSPVEMCEMVDRRTLFGRFRSLYSGHSYDNTDVGEVPHSSVSLRPFFFTAYLSEGGRIYIGSQYLGQFGGYMGLFRTLRLFLPASENIVSHAFRHDASTYEGAKPKEVRVNFSRKSTDIFGDTKFGHRGAMTFKQSSTKDEQFKSTVSTNILARLGQSKAALRRAVAGMLADNDMLTLRDDDIEDCVVVASVDGKTQTINVIEAGHFATKFPLGVADYIKGHPDKSKTQAAMLNLLRNKIIARVEDV